MIDPFIQLAGSALCVLALADLYVTVLYARSDLSLLSSRLFQQVWRGFRAIGSRLSGGSRDRMLTFAGPTLVVSVLFLWLSLLLVGFALISWPALGNEIKKTSGQTPTGFTTALYYSGYTLATLGYGDIVPQSGFYRVLAVAEALVGFSVLTLALTYLMNVYSALVRRNTLALALHHRSAGSDDAAELLARLGAGGEFSGASIQLSQLAERLHDLYESHHSYPILHYFHFREPFYAMAHVVGFVADAASLSLTAVEQNRYRSFAESAAVAESSGGANYMLTQLAGVFLPSAYRPDGAGERVEDQDFRQWRARFEEAAERLARAGITTPDDRSLAADRYVELRRQWDPYVTAFRRYMLERPAGPTGASKL